MTSIGYLPYTCCLSKLFLTLQNALFQNLRSQILLLCNSHECVLFLYVPCSFRTLTIMTLHSFPFFVVFSNTRSFVTSSLCDLFLRFIFSYSMFFFCFIYSQCVWLSVKLSKTSISITCPQNFSSISLKLPHSPHALSMLFSTFFGRTSFFFFASQSPSRT